MEIALLAVIAVLAVVAADVIAPRVNVAAPLLLVVLGVLISLLPVFPDWQLDPEWILVGILPPLLYSAAVSMPTMNFRRDFRSISGLSVVLVIITAVILGFFLSWLIPEIDLATGIALGAILSPTDAVATSIVRRLGAPHRLVTVLSGESLFNDATALVLLRSAVAASAASVSFFAVTIDFLWAVLSAVVIGWLVGQGNLRLRGMLRDPVASTALSFTAPFIAYAPTEVLGGSGLVAAVTAGLVTGAGQVRYLSPSQRMSDVQNWRTVELILEGGVFLIMGLELQALIDDAADYRSGVFTALWMAGAALLLATLVRAIYIAPLVWRLERHSSRSEAARRRFDELDEPTDTDAFRALGGGRIRPPVRWADPADPSRLRRRLADLDYFRSERVGMKGGTIVVWAGMRGVVTVAAAQTLPADTPARSFLILIAFLVAAGSLIIQGGTLAPLIRALRLPGTAESDADERRRLADEMTEAATGVLTDPELHERKPWVAEQVRLLAGRVDDDVDTEELALGPGVNGIRLPDRSEIRRVRRRIIAAQRARLLELRDSGQYGAEALTRELIRLDALEISINASGD